MRILEKETLSIISKTKPNANMESVCIGLDIYGMALGLNKPHRLAQYAPQITHESGRFRYDREAWGPTAAQKRYDTRTDLGNTPQVDGDGYRLRGRGPMQITGGHNYRGFTAWAKEKFPQLNPPDFFANPDMVNADPWEGLGPLWYWERTNLNKYADAGNIEMVTRRINGGLNGYADRLTLYDRSALVLLGLNPDDIRGFQTMTPGLVVDGLSGPATRAALHKSLLDLPAIDVSGGKDDMVTVGAEAVLAEIAKLLNAYFDNKEK